MSKESSASDLFAGGRVLLQPLRRAWNTWRYHTLARNHQIPIFSLSEAERIRNQIAFADVFRQLQQRYAWLPSPIYAVGGAADPAFLSVLIRALLENEFKCVFEFGAGQTTQILAAWAKESGAEVFTFEDNEFWANKCEACVSSPTHHVIHSPLKESPTGERWYDLSDFKTHFPTERADLFIVDGPIGTAERSRAGIIDAFPDLCREEWAIIWDDVDRIADLKSLAAFVQSLRGRAVPFEMNCCQTFRTQGLIFTPKYGSLKHYC